MSGSFGVKATKEALDCAFAVVSAFQLANADGKINFNDVVFVIPIFPTIGPVVADAALIPKELGELDAAEEADLMEYAATKLNSTVSDVSLRAKVRSLVHLGLALAESVSVFRTP
jgi:hypothetical protein